MTPLAPAPRLLHDTAAGLTAVWLACAGAHAATPCTDLAGSFPGGATLKLSLALGYNGHPGSPKVLSVTAKDVATNGLSKTAPTPALCAVTLTVSSSGDATGSAISVGALLPEGAPGTHTKSAWNGRFLGTGNGGLGGAVATGNMLDTISPTYVATGKTFVAANTDLGDGILFHCTTLFCGSAQGVAEYPNQTPGGLYGDAAAITDFGYGATHLMTLAGQALTGIFYGEHAKYSYFDGCSEGGGQALMEAQRFPDDYDGILAGSPAYNFTRLHAAAAGHFEVTHFGPVDGYGLPDSFLTDAALLLGHAGVLARCAGKDGGLPTDDFLTRPYLCSFDAATLQCTGAPGEVPCTDPAATSCSCLTPDQTIALNQFWSGERDSDNRLIYPGWERGAEENANQIGTGQPALTEPLYDSTDYWVFGPDFAWQSLFRTISAPAPLRSSIIKHIDGAAVGSQTFASVLNATSANLSAFNAHGGKLILYAGYADPRIPTASTIDYYNQAMLDDPATHTYAALYLAPGMGHCNGGPGANVFGNEVGQPPPAPANPADDVLAALLQWREAGIAPGKIIATKYVNDTPSQGIAFQRPLCPYPMDAHYAAGNNNDPNSYVCKHDPIVRNQEFTPLYGPH
jgi:feruloyl esterase